MNLEDIKTTYFQEINEALLHSVERMNSYMVTHYRQIVEEKCFNVHRAHITPMETNSPKWKDFVYSLQQHYKDNWDIIFQKTDFNVKYKHDLTNFETEMDLQTIPDKQIEEPTEEGTRPDRSELLDL